jgi:hypothetical protein
VSAAPSTRPAGWLAPAGRTVRARSSAVREWAERHPALSGFFLFVAVAGVARPASYRTPLGHDTGAYLYVGDVILHGGTPYVDAANNKGPLLLLLFAAIRFVGGTSVVGVRLSLLLFAALAALFLAAYVSRLTDRSTGLVAGVALAVLSGAWAFPGEDPNSEQYGIAPVAAALWLATRGGWRSAAGSGACAAAATAINPALGVVLPFVAFELWRANAPDAGPRWQRFGAAVAGGVVVAGSLVLWLALSGALDDMWTQMGRQALGTVNNTGDYASSTPPPAQPDRAWWDVNGASMWFVGIAGCLVGLRDRRLRRVAIPALAWIVVAWLRVKPATYFYPHHYYPVMLGIAAGIAVGAAAVWPEQTARRVGVAVLVLAAPLWSEVIQPQLQALRVPANLRVASGINYGSAYPAAEYVRAHTRPDDTIYVNGSHGEVYWLAKRRAPTRFFDNFPIYVHPAYAAERLRDLRRHPPRALVILPLRNPDDAATYLLKTGRYRAVTLTGGYGGVYLRSP